MRFGSTIACSLFVATTLWVVTAHASESDYTTTVTACADCEAVGAVDTVSTSESFRGFETVTDVLEPLPGVQPRRTGTFGAPSFLSVRGSGPEHVRVYLDGVPLHGARAVAFDLSSIPIDLIDRVRLYRGNVPVAFGQAGAGGVLDLRTRRGQGDAVFASATWGSWMTRKLTLAGSLERGPTQLLAGVTYAGTEGDFGYYDTNGTAFNLEDDATSRRGNNRHDAGSGLFRVATRVGDWRTTGVVVGQHRLGGVPGTATAPAAEAEFGETAVYGALRVRNPQVSDLLALELVGAAGWTRFDYRDPAGEVGVGNQDRTDVSLLWLASARPSLFISQRTRLHAVLEASGEGYQPTDRVDSTELEEAHRLTLSAGLELAVDPIDELVVSLGARVDHVRNDLTGDPTAFTPIDQEDLTLVSPQAGITYRLDSDRTAAEVFAAAGLASRVPGFVELYGDDGATVGNPELREERRIGVEAGATASFEADHVLVSGGTTGYWRTVDDLIVAEEHAVGFRIPENIENARLFGVEARFDVASRYGGLSVTGAWLDSTTESRLERFNGQPIPFRPRWMGDLSLWGEVHRVRLGWSLAAMSEVSTDRADLRHTPGRALQSVEARYRVHGVEGLTIVAEIENLTDVRSGDVSLPNGFQTFQTTRPLADFQGYPLPGRSLSLTVGYAHDFGI